MKNTFWAITALALTISVHAQTQTTKTVKVGGDIDKPFTITTASFHNMKQLTVKGTGHDGKPHEYTGVLLSDIISQASNSPEAALRGKALAKYVLIKAADGYKAVIAMAEINTEFNDKQIILADKIDGKPLDEKNGPYQVIIPDEKKWGRWVREVTEIDVQTAKD